MILCFWCTHPALSQHMGYTCCEWNKWIHPKHDISSPSIVKLSLGFDFIMGIVRTSFGLDSKTGVDSGSTSPNNKFVEHERES